MKSSEIFAGALELLGPNGEHWIRGKLNDGMGKYCLLGAMSKACGVEDTLLLREHTLAYPGTSHRPELVRADRLLTFGVLEGEQGHVFNDIRASNFGDVKAVLCKAVKIALEEESHE